MTRDELRKATGYIDAKKKIENYPTGFDFSVPLCTMPKAKRNAMVILLGDCVKENLIESIAIDLDIAGEVTSERFVRL